MNINNFEEYIDETIQKRGRKYYKDQNVYDEYEENDNEYKFEVFGSQDYTVTVKLNKNEDIVYSNCNCPYDYGPTCKHEVAVYYKLKEILKNTKGNNLAQNNKKKKSQSKKLSFEEIINTLDRNQLLEIVREISENDNEIKNYILLKYSPVDDKTELQNCKKIIKSIIKKYLRRGGYIKWEYVFSFSKELESVLDRIEKFKNRELAIDAQLLLLDEVFNVFNYIDDSDGFIGDLVENIFSMMEKTVSDVVAFDDEITKEKIFDKLLYETDEEFFNGWPEYKKRLYNICCEVAFKEELRDKLKSKIIEFRDSEAEDSFYGEYVADICLESIYKIIDMYGSEEEVEKFLYENIDRCSFLEFLVQKYIDKEEYEMALNLIGRLEKNKDFKFKKCGADELRYRVYKDSGQTENQYKIAKMLLLNGKVGYYQELKSLSNDENFFKNIKQELKDCGRITEWEFVNIAEEEMDLEEILSYVMKYPNDIERFSNMLVPKYKDEVVGIYEIFIKNLAEEASNRTKYSVVCSKIRTYKKIAGNDKKNEIIDELKALYKRKPAFIDELSKIK